jgi:hypothetical protein
MKKWLVQPGSAASRHTPSAPAITATGISNADNIDNHDETSTSPELGNGNETHSKLIERAADSIRPEALMSFVTVGCLHVFRQRESEISEER